MPDSVAKPPAILILFAHPAQESSRINRELVRAVRDLAGVTFNDLYEAYPEFDIDVKREQKLAEQHQIIVFQHPFYWYSTPALLKQWQDLVLEHGWAYGKGGAALKGKTLLSAITTGGRAEGYQPDGMHKRSLLELLAPIAQTAELCGMNYLNPFAVHGTHSMSREQARAKALEYRSLLEALRDGVNNSSSLGGS